MVEKTNKSAYFSIKLVGSDTLCKSLHCSLHTLYSILNGIKRDKRIEKELEGMGLSPKRWRSTRTRIEKKGMII